MPKPELVALQFQLGYHPASILTKCKYLQELVLRNCRLQMGQCVMYGLSCVTWLTSLALDNILTKGAELTLANLLSTSVGLTANAPCLHPVAHLHGVQQLILRNMQPGSSVGELFAGDCTCTSPSAYSIKFPDLTHLEVHSCQDVNLSQDNTPNICALTALQKLCLSELLYICAPGSDGHQSWCCKTAQVL